MLHAGFAAGLQLGFEGFWSSLTLLAMTVVILAGATCREDL
jgi:hypothetical protein